MKTTPTFSGVIAPVLTPLGEDGAHDLDRFVEHCEWLMEAGCTGLAPFGTTSEANSLGIDERMEMLEEIVEAGIPGSKLMPGTGMCSLADTILLTDHAVELGCAGVLMLPPFYYKNPSEEGLFRFFAEVIEAIRKTRSTARSTFRRTVFATLAGTPNKSTRSIGRSARKNCCNCSTSTAATTAATIVLCPAAAAKTASIRRMC